MVDAARRPAARKPRRDAILEAIAHAAERLLLARSWREAVDELLSRLGAAADVSRAYVVEAPTGGGGDTSPVSWVGEWTAPGVERLTDALGRTPEGPGDRFGRLALVVGDVAELNDPTRGELARLEIGSFASCPIVIDDVWWGTVGFDDRRDRSWTNIELDGLRAAANLFGAAISRQRSEAETLRAQEDYRRFVEHIPAVTYTDLVDPETHRAHMGFVSPQIEALLGYPPDRFLEDPKFWFSLIHPEDLPRVEAAAQADTPFDEEYRMRASDGHDVWVHDTSTPVWEDDRLLYWQGFTIDVTARREAEQALRLAEERARAIIEQTPVITYQEPHSDDDDYDANASWMYVSPQVELILGYTAEEWTSAGFWLDRIHPDDRDEVMTESARTVRTREPYSQDYRVFTKDGRLAWFHDEAVLIEGHAGRPGFWQGVMIDITERKLAEDQLRHAEERHRALIEHIPAIVYTESPEGDPETFYISPQVEQILGYTPREWTRTPDFWRTNVHPEDRPRVLDVAHRSNATKDGYALDYRFHHADGRWVWIHDEATFVPELGGFWQGFMLDITERKDAEEQLREAEEKFRTIVEQNQAVFYIQELDPGDPERSLTTYIAPGNTDLIGYTFEEIREDPSLWRRIVHPDDRERVAASAAEAAATGSEHTSMEYRLIAKDGRIVWVQDESRLVRAGDHPPYWQGFLLDITERKAAEQQLAHALQVERQAAARLRSLDDMKNTFLQAVSHDLRTPLAAILGLAITLERRDVVLDEQDASDLAHRIAQNARRLDRLVLNLLDMDRLARGIVAPKLEMTDVSALAQRVVTESELISPSRIRTELHSVTVPLDAAKVERILENLLANAARHAPPDATIWVRVDSRGDGCLIRVEDDGPGVPEDLREVIFEPFRQGPDAPRHAPGVGVGLALVRSFAELHGGRAWVTEREGGGASFRVLLPNEPTPPQAAEPGSSAWVPAAGV